MHLPCLLIYPVSLCALLFVVESWILRLPCKTEANFKIKVKDYALTTSIIHARSVTSVEQCFEECENHNLCRSVNHKETGSNNCELNSQSKEKVDAYNFILRQEWTYYTTSYNTNNIGSYCDLFNPCNSTQFCVDTCQCPAFQCIANCDRHLGCGSFVPTNIALNKPANLSTQHDAVTIPGNAVDGNLFSSHHTCAITKQNTGHPPWFRVDLLQKSRIKFVALKNRKQCCWNRMNPFDVRIGDRLENDGRVNPKCVSGESFTTPGQYRLFECPYTMEGRYVMVFAESAIILELCELEVYGTY